MKHEALFKKLAASSFRSSFRLNAKDAGYLASKGLEEIRVHARQFIEDRLAGAAPANDGSQTPMRGHPVFVAQHAVGACCRGCTLKTYGISKGRAMTEQEIDHVVDVICEWLARQPVSASAPESAKPSKIKEKKQLSLF